MKILKHSLVEDNNLKPDIFYQPQISNMESGDAFCVISTANENGTKVYKLIILQITVAKKHIIKINGLQHIMAAYPEEIRTNMVEKVFVFITPKNGNLNSFQSYVNRDGKTPKMNIPQDISEFKQYVMKYELAFEIRE